MLKVILVLFLGLYCVNSTNVRVRKWLLKELGHKVQCSLGSGSYQSQIQQLFNCQKVQTIAEKLKPEVQPTFDYLDINHNGLITTEELLQRTRDLGFNQRDLTKEEKFKVSICDRNKDGSLTLLEYSQCSVWSYGIPTVALDSNRDRRLSKTELTTLIKTFSAYSYKTISDQRQRQEINTVTPEIPDNYSILDLAKIDTKLFRLYLDQLQGNTSK